MFLGGWSGSGAVGGHKGRCGVDGTDSPRASSGRAYSDGSDSSSSESLKLLSPCGSGASGVSGISVGAKVNSLSLSDPPATELIKSNGGFRIPPTTAISRGPMCMASFRVLELASVQSYLSCMH